MDWITVDCLEKVVVFTLGLDNGEVESGRHQQTQGYECRHVWGNGR